MRRRAFVAGSTAFAATARGLSFASAQSGSDIPRVGILSTETSDNEVKNWEPFRAGMHALGYDDGKTVVFEFRFAGYDFRRLPALAAELAALPVRVIVANSTPAVIAAKSITSEIPIVSPQMADPVGSGFARSLARPGGSVTGLSTMSAELGPKRLELLRDIIPSLSRAGMVWDANIQSFALTAHLTEDAARTLGVSLAVYGVKTPADLDAAFAAMTSAQVQAVVVAIPGGSAAAKDAATLVDAIAQHRWPAVYTVGEYVPAGGLIAYGPNYPDLFRRIAPYVDKILKGGRPADLPIEEPDLFELRVNLKTAKALGLTIPPSILVRADEVIE